MLSSLYSCQGMRVYKKDEQQEELFSGTKKRDNKNSHVNKNGKTQQGPQSSSKRQVVRTCMDRVTMQFELNTGCAAN